MFVQSCIYQVLIKIIQRNFSLWVNFLLTFFAKILQSLTSRIFVNIILRMEIVYTSSDNEWQRLVQRMTTSDNELQRMSTNITTNENKWKRMRASKGGWFRFQNEAKYAMYNYNIFSNMEYLYIAKIDDIYFQYNILCFYHAIISSCFPLSVLLKFIKAC